MNLAILRSLGLILHVDQLLGDHPSVLGEHDLIALPPSGLLFCVPYSAMTEPPFREAWLHNRAANGGWLSRSSFLTFCWIIARLSPRGSHANPFGFAIERERVNPNSQRFGFRIWPRRAGG